MPYQPNGDLIEGPLVFANGKAYTVQGSIAVPLVDVRNFLSKLRMYPYYLFSWDDY